jgi:hypothetical protein
VGTRRATCFPDSTAFTAAAEPHIPHEKPIHGNRALHVLTDLLLSSKLVFGFLVGKGGHKASEDISVGRKGVSPHTFPNHVSLEKLLGYFLRSFPGLPEALLPPPPPERIQHHLLIRRSRVGADFVHLSKGNVETLLPRKFKHQILLGAKISRKLLHPSVATDTVILVNNILPFGKSRIPLGGRSSEIGTIFQPHAGNSHHFRIRKEDSSGLPVHKSSRERFFQKIKTHTLSPGENLRMGRAEGNTIPLPLQSLHIGSGLLETTSEGGNRIEKALPIFRKRSVSHEKGKNSRKGSEELLPGGKGRKTFRLFERLPEPSVGLSLSFQSPGIEKDHRSSWRERGCHERSPFGEGKSLFPGRSRKEHLLHLGDTALIPGRKEPETLHGIIEILHPYRQGLRGCVEIHHTPPESMLPRRGYVIHPGVSHGVKPA